MIVQKPNWVSHNGDAVYSIDFHPDGTRFATAGRDQKVRIWNAQPLEDEAAEGNPKIPKVLATLCNHLGPVNCVRWSHRGSHMASGSDDQMVLVHEKKPGRGATSFGSDEGPNLENWRVTYTLRGHTADVVDVAWSPDDTMLASCSLDNTVRIWSPATGALLATLSGHVSLVKGVAWDPISSYVASQSDDKSVLVWRCSDWSLASRIQGPYEKTVGATFFRRLGWSPCGTFLTTTHAFEAPQHTAAVIERGEWTKTFDFVGHVAPIVAVRYNHGLFRRLPRPSSLTKVAGPETRTSPTDAMPIDDDRIQKPAERDGALNRSDAQEQAKGMSSSQLPAATQNGAGLPGLPKRWQGGGYNCLAMGSQDCRVSVWATDSAKPVLVAKHFFTAAVVDLTWSPSGYMLLCCSTDGTVAGLLFSAKELGVPYSGNEMDALKRERYGEPLARKLAVAESPALLAMEQAITAHANAHAPPNPSATPLPPWPPPSAPALGLRAPARGAGPPAGSPSKQSEKRTADGRRRITPLPLTGLLPEQDSLPLESAAPVGMAGGMPSASQVFEGGGPSFLPGEVGGPAEAELAASKRLRFDGATAGPQRNGNWGSVSAGSGGLAVQVCNHRKQDHMVRRAQKEAEIPRVLSIHVRGGNGADEEGEEPGPPNALEARNGERGASGSGMCEIVCSRGGAVLWRDYLASRASALAGSRSLWAVAGEDGSLQIFTAGGRRALPSLALGSPALFVECDLEERLLVLTQAGDVHLWDIAARSRLLHESIAPLLLSQGMAAGQQLEVVSLRLLSSGAPMVMLSNRHAYLFHISMRSWMRMSSDSFTGSQLLSSLQPLQGLLSGLPPAIDAMAYTSPWSFGDEGDPGLLRGQIMEKMQTRAHVEDQLAAAEVLESPQEYRRHLATYVRVLTKQADQRRLREVCESFLGPPGAMARASTVVAASSQWQPSVLGLSKRELLRTDILPIMAANQAVQRLLNEFLDLLE